MPAEEPDISIRPALPMDFAFVAGLYLSGMQALLTKLGTWDEDRLASHFARVFRLEQAQIIRSDGVDIGWLQLTELPDKLHLDQLHLVDGWRSRGIGTRLIAAILDRARRTDTPVELDVVRGNAAISLYGRLGFRVVGEGEEKLKMRWEP